MSSLLLGASYGFIRAVQRYRALQIVAYFVACIVALVSAHEICSAHVGIHNVALKAEGAVCTKGRATRARIVAEARARKF